MIMLPIKAFDTVQPLFGLTAFGPSSISWSPGGSTSWVRSW